MGLRSSSDWYEDPRRLLFAMSRYKFVAKMLTGKQRVLEIGCGDAFCTRIVQQEVNSLVGIDFDPIFVEDVNERMDKQWPFECRVHDILANSVEGNFDAIYALDVIEHIEKKEEHRFITNMMQSLHDNGALIIGTPSIQSQAYASKRSKQGHVNCKEGQELKELMLKYFANVFIFSMNDEVIHTGFYPMAHYLFALCVGQQQT
jgi:cyclopropane fatty-acyl-phospholipid synthase-like methyltransferase